MNDYNENNLMDALKSIIEQQVNEGMESLNFISAEDYDMDDYITHDSLDFDSFITTNDYDPDSWITEECALDLIDKKIESKLERDDTEIKSTAYKVEEMEMDFGSFCAGFQTDIARIDEYTGFLNTVKAEHANQIAELEERLSKLDLAHHVAIRTLDKQHERLDGLDASDDIDTQEIVWLKKRVEALETPWYTKAYNAIKTKLSL